MSPRGRGLDPETAALVSLNAHAGRLAAAMSPPREAAAELRAVAGKRTDLLARVAGQFLGGVLGKPGGSRPDALLAVGYLMLAGADPEATVLAAREAAQWAQERLHGAGVAYAAEIEDVSVSPSTTTKAPTAG